MSHFFTKMQVCKAIITQFDPTGRRSLNEVLKAYFKEHKQFGSTDRRLYSEVVYRYLRLYKGCQKDWTLEQKIVFCNANVHADNLKTNQLVAAFNDHWGKELNFNPAEYSLALDLIFPQAALMSPSLDKKMVLQKICTATHLFWIRTKRSQTKQVINELNNKDIEFLEHYIQKNALQLPNSTDIESFSAYKNGFFEVQDISSQQTEMLFGNTLKMNDNWWDCCTASGGKSLMIKDIQKDIRLFVSDNRGQVLQNLVERFQRSKATFIQKGVVELLQKPIKLPETFPKQFDGIVADLPCSGSGTWHREPENMTRFEQLNLNEFAKNQFEIIQNITPFLKTGKPLIYITCSLYAIENEHLVAKILKELPYQLIEQRYFTDGDILFGATLVKL